MSGIYIPIELPEKIDPAITLDFAWSADGKRYARLYHYGIGGLTGWHEIFFVPDHGRCIDADALEKDIDKYIDGEESRSRFHHWVQVQNVVIPADKEVEG